MVHKDQPIVVIKDGSKGKEETPDLWQSLSNQTAGADGTKDLSRYLGKWVFKRDGGKDVFAENARVNMQNQTVTFDEVSENAAGVPVKKPASMGYNEFLDASQAYNTGVNVKKTKRTVANAGGAQPPAQKTKTPSGINWK